MSTPVDVASQLQALKDRGVTNPAEFAVLGAERLAETVQWFDAQQGRVAAGVLVAELRNGGRQQRVRKAASLSEREAAYGRSIVERLEQAFGDDPTICRPNWGPHPAAIAAVIRSDWLHGKGSVRRSVVRAAVADWERRLGDEPEQVAA